MRFAIPAVDTLLDHARRWDRGVYIALGAFAAASLLSLSRGLGRSEAPIYRAPRGRESQASPVAPCPYPNDAIPGGRDVETPWGITRVYEWGPADGRKVLFVHGISTPCLSLAALADALARAGCRVMLFDLFGRGHSDTPSPKHARQDAGLFSAQVLSVAASSELDWTSGFSLVGYSLGGGIAASFAYFYPRLVRSLTLIATSGLMRPGRISWSSRLLYGKILPEWAVYYWVGLRLRGGVSLPRLRNPDKAITATDAARKEAPGEDEAVEDSSDFRFEGRPAFDLNRVVTWQADTHPGFAAAFVDSIQHAPIHDGHARWRAVGERGSLQEGKVLVILGAQDTVILAEETIEDITDALGRDNVTFQILKGGHDVPFANASGCARAIQQHWNAA